MYICDTCPFGTYVDWEAAMHEQRYLAKHHMDFIPQDAKVLSDD